MIRSNVYLSVLLSGLLAVAGAHAQSAPAGGNSDGPPKAGEASNQTQGVPNARTTNSPFSEAPILSRDAVRAQGAMPSPAAATASTPPQAGEATTMVSGNPNIDPAAANLPKTRAQVLDELMSRPERLRMQREAMRMGYSPYVYGTPQ